MVSHLFFLYILLLIESKNLATIFASSLLVAAVNSYVLHNSISGTIFVACCGPLRYLTLKIVQHSSFVKSVIMVSSTL